MWLVCLCVCLVIPYSYSLSSLSQASRLQHLKLSCSVFLLCFPLSSVPLWHFRQVYFFSPPSIFPEDVFSPFKTIVSFQSSGLVRSQNQTLHLAEDWCLIWAWKVAGGHPSHSNDQACLMILTIELRSDKPVLRTKLPQWHLDPCLYLREPWFPSLKWGIIIPLSLSDILVGWTQTLHKMLPTGRGTTI